VCTALYFLQPHAFLCRGNRHWVILDVNRDKYLCVDRRQFESLGPSLHGWEDGACDPPATAAERERSAATPRDDAIALAHKLLSLEILSERADSAKYARPTAYPLPTDAIDMDLPAPSLRSPCTHAPPFFLSSAKASRQLRGQTFESTVAFVRARKRRKGDSERPLDIALAHSLTSVFDRLRLFYPRSYQCLFDSLALINFLAHFNLYPDWVFGVTAEPFEAHCWVQAGSIVLNDTLERVSAFTPIMYV
jgi:hypothetical protein